MNIKEGEICIHGFAGNLKYLDIRKVPIPAWID